MKQFVNIIVLLILSAFSVNAQMHNGRMFDKELREKLQNYHKENVCPQWMEWRQKLLNSMSDEDLQKLNSLKEEAQKIISEKSECLENCRKENFSKKSDSTQKGKGPQNKGMKHGKHKCFKECGIGEAKEYYAKQLKEILSRYDNTVKEILEEAKTYQEKWRNDKNAIIEEHLSTKSDSSSNHKGRMKGMMEGMLNPKGKFLVGMLLMWNGSCESNPEDLFELGTSKMLDTPQISVNAYPNPFTEKVNISFKLLKNSDVKLTITNTNGEIISKLFEGNLPQGEHNYEFKAGNNLSGAYLYSLDVDGKITTGKIVLNK